MGRKQFIIQISILLKTVRLKCINHLPPSTFQVEKKGKLSWSKEWGHIDSAPHCAELHMVWSVRTEVGLYFMWGQTHLQMPDVMPSLMFFKGLWHS